MSQSTDSFGSTVFFDILDKTPYEIFETPVFHEIYDKG